MTADYQLERWQGTLEQKEAPMESYFAVLDELLGPPYWPQTIPREDHLEYVSFDLEEAFEIELELLRVKVHIGSSKGSSFER